MDLLKPVKKVVLNKIENTDAASLGKSVAGLLAIAGGIIIVTMAKVDSDDIIAAVTEPVATETIPVDAVVETVTEVASETVEAATE